MNTCFISTNKEIQRLSLEGPEAGPMSKGPKRFAGSNHRAGSRGPWLDQDPTSVCRKQSQAPDQDLRYQLRVESVLVQRGTWFLPDLRSLQSCISPQVGRLPFKCVRYPRTVAVIIITYFLNTKWVRV